MPHLRHLLREYLELKPQLVEEFVQQFEEQWKNYIATQTTDEKAATIMETLLGTPNWIKEKEAR